MHDEIASTATISDLDHAYHLVHLISSADNAYRLYHACDSVPGSETRFVWTGQVMRMTVVLPKGKTNPHQYIDLYEQAMVANKTSYKQSCKLFKIYCVRLLTAMQQFCSDEILVNFNADLARKRNQVAFRLSCMVDSSEVLRSIVVPLGCFIPAEDLDGKRGWQFIEDVLRSLANRLEHEPASESHRVCAIGELDDGVEAVEKELSERARASLISQAGASEVVEVDEEVVRAAREHNRRKQELSTKVVQPETIKVDPDRTQKIVKEFSMPRCELPARGIYEAVKRRVVGQDHAVKALATTWASHYFAVKNTQNHARSAVLLHGPSGCGKSHLVKSFGDVVGVPVIHVSAPSIVSDGIIGMCPADIIASLLHRCEEGCKEPCGIVCLDEFDKLLSSSGELHSHYYSGSALSSLLRLLDGGSIQLDSHDWSARQKQKYPTDVSTRSIMFILAGAWTNVRGDNTENSIGFTQASKGKMKGADAAIRESIPPEIRNRLSEICELKPLGRPEYEELVRLFDGPLSAIRQRVYSAEFTDEVIEHIVDSAMDGTTQGRGIGNEVAKILREIEWSNIGSEENIRVLLGDGEYEIKSLGHCSDVGEEEADDHSVDDDDDDEKPF